MGVYDAYNDEPRRIKTEGETIVLTFQQGIPQAAQGTITWTIPNSQTDNIGSPQGAYAGIIVIVSDNPINTYNLPTDGTIYVGDPTVNLNLFTGDKIGNALVVGAFYETQKIAKGLPVTTSLVVNDLVTNGIYYVAAFAVDQQFRYHTAGVRAQSSSGEVLEPNGTAVAAYQSIKLGDPNSRDDFITWPSDGTGLIPGASYEFDVLIDTTFPYRSGQGVFRIKVNGNDCLTYGDMVTTVNKQFALINQPPMSPVSPNTNQLYWNSTNNSLSQLTYDSTNIALNLTPVSNVIVQSTDPTQVAVGQYWYNGTALYNRVGSSTPVWSQNNIIPYNSINATAFSCDDYWINLGTNNAYVWGGANWCSTPLIESTVDPSCPPSNLCGSYWYDNQNSTLYKYDNDTSSWITTSAIVWGSPPNNLSNGTFWFDLLTNTLHQMTGSGWSLVTNVVISTTQPLLAPMSYWYNPATEVLEQYNGTSWTQIAVLVWPGDPTVVSSCDVWWNHATSPGTLSVWDVVNGKWQPVAQFYDQATDPRLAPTIPAGTIWYNISTNTSLLWNGATWNTFSYVINSYDPTKPHFGDAWVSSAGYYVFNGTSWVQVYPIISANDPTILPTGTYWYNTSNNSLQNWNGTSWVTNAFSTTIPYPQRNQTWYNSSNNLLYRWTELNQWQQINAICTMTLNPRGYLHLATRDTGAGMHIKILQPGGDNVVATGFADFATETIPSAGIYDLNAAMNDPYIVEQRPQPITTVAVQAFLFANLVKGYKMYREVVGADGVTNVPAYMQLGVGTDGTPDQRRMLADQIRRQLGYPAVDVELDKKQVDDCITYALQQLRQKSSLCYKRGFFFLDIAPHKQKYVLSNRQLGYHKIADVTSAYRFTSAFLATANGSGVYGQIVLQHLYNMGTYDLSSFFMVSNYVETLELLFSTRLTFTWDEPTRLLWLQNTFVLNERILLDCTVWKTEEEILTYRLSQPWVREWALSEAMLMLANQRGKYTSGLGNGITLNASDLQTKAERMQEKLLGDLDNFYAQDVESYSMFGQFAIG